MAAEMPIMRFVLSFSVFGGYVGCIPSIKCAMLPWTLIDADDGKGGIDSGTQKHFT